VSITIYWPGAKQIGAIKGNSHEESEIYSQKIALTRDVSVSVHVVCRGASIYDNIMVFPGPLFGISN
jgi:hypothetical protein